MTRAPCFASQLTGACYLDVKSMLNNGAAYAYAQFGWGNAVELETIDLRCCVPKIVAVLICLLM